MGDAFQTLSWEEGTKRCDEMGSKNSAKTTGAEAGTAGGSP